MAPFPEVVLSQMWMETAHRGRGPTNGTLCINGF